MGQVIGFASLRYTIGLKNSPHFLIQSEVKQKPIVTRLHSFSRASRQLHVFTSSFDRLIGLSVSFVIGQSSLVPRVFSRPTPKQGKRPRLWPEWLLWFWFTTQNSIENCSKVFFWHIYSWGGAVASWLVRSSPDRAVRVRALAGDIVLCSWARNFTLTVPLSTQVYKWVPANLMLGGNPAMD